MSQEATKTGVGPIATVAVEQNFSEEKRIIKDKLACSLLPLTTRLFVWFTQFSIIRNWMVQKMEQPAPGLWSGFMCRKRYIDDRLSEDSIDMDAVVNLGAGFDTRTYRLPSVKQLPTWEIDQEENIESKRDRLLNVFGDVPEHISLVSIDFDREELDIILEKQGYSTNMKTFFILEAVTQYLENSGIESTFNFLAKAASGSRLVFTYILKDFIAGEKMYNQKSLYEEWVIQKKAWIYGMDKREVADFLSGYGWRLINNVSYEELAKRYVEPTGRDLKSMSIERLVYAEKL